MFVASSMVLKVCGNVINSENVFMLKLRSGLCEYGLQRLTNSWICSRELDTVADTLHSQEQEC